MPTRGAPDGYRAALESEWLELTRHVLPAMAVSRGWTVRSDHCFQRIFLDAAVGGVWYDVVLGRPAYRHIDRERLVRAVTLARSIASGQSDLDALNRQSVAWRAARNSRQAEATLGLLL